MTTTSDPVHSRTRMRPEDRKTLIKSIARDVFAQRSYATSGLAEIAERGKISKTLLYHYFPDGRPGVMVAVMDDLDHELDAVTSAALAGHNDIAGRIAAYVEAMLTYFSREPDAFHLLYRDPWGSGEPMVIRRAGGAGGTCHAACPPSSRRSRRPGPSCSPSPPASSVCCWRSPSS